MKDKIKKFVERLANTPEPEYARNVWNYSKPENEIRRKNLIGYFEQMAKLKPEVIIIGEAPGYRGCGRVGMPFSSEKLILSHPFFENKKIFAIENGDAPITEASASIVWKTFDKLNFYPLMWATYPFHPHKPNAPLTNRAPRPEEVLLGKQFLREIMDIYNIKQVIAVGRVAEKSLAEMDIEAIPIRHPSHGGATMFAKGLSDFVKKENRKN
jgi:uracil-DNA glycosylase